MNPVVAVLFGWLTLAEPIGPPVILGTLVIVPAVILTIAPPRDRAGGSPGVTTQTKA